MTKKPTKSTPKRPTDEQATAIVQAFYELEQAIETLRESGFSSREISLTITNAEQASMWLQYAASALDIDLDDEEGEDEEDDDEEGEDEEDDDEEGKSE